MGRHQVPVSAMHGKCLNCQCAIRWHNSLIGESVCVRAVTSDNDKQSMIWVGSYGNLQVYFNVIFGDDDLYFTTSVILRNIGTTQLKDVYYMRNVDPDQVRGG